MYQTGSEGLVQSPGLRYWRIGASVVVVASEIARCEQTFGEEREEMRSINKESFGLFVLPCGIGVEYSTIDFIDAYLFEFTSVGEQVFFHEFLDLNGLLFLGDLFFAGTGGRGMFEKQVDVPTFLFAHFIIY